MPKQSVETWPAYRSGFKLRLAAVGVNPEFKHGLFHILGLVEQSSIELDLQSTSKTLLSLDDGLARKQALRKHLEIFGNRALLFAEQRKGQIDEAEQVIEQLNQVGYRISASEVTQLKNGMP